MYCKSIYEVRRYVKNVATPYSVDNDQGNIIAVVQDLSNDIPIDYYYLDYDPIIDVSTALVCVHFQGAFIELEIIPLFSLKQKEFLIIEHSHFIGMDWQSVRQELIEKSDGYYQ